MKDEASRYHELLLWDIYILFFQAGWLERNKSETTSTNEGLEPDGSWKKYKSGWLDKMENRRGYCYRNTIVMSGSRELMETH